MKPIRVEETVWITLSDGCRLAARLWLPPEGAGPVPAVLEYLPYRRRDRHRGDDAILHPALAAAGYASIRVDMRGSGDSDGTMSDEYTPGEWKDAVEVIDWITRQAWCSGAVGMIGLSWSGFNALQIAALAPPALKAIVTTCASDDRFADDMHYMGGCLLNDNIQYGSTLFTWLATPPDPAIVGDRWRDLWKARLEAVEVPPAARWMRHSDRDAYWRSGSVCEDYGRIQAAVLAVGGWADGYTNAVMRLLAGLSGPRKGLIGPWGHAFPHVATPGPAVDFLCYVVRWFDHWLKGRDTGIMREPMLTCWLQEYEPPQPRYTERKGRWIAEAAWPSPDVAVRFLCFSDRGLGVDGGPPHRVVRSLASTGQASGEWCPYGWGPDMPLDQREDDAQSACFDSAPLDLAFEILGGARVSLDLTVDGPEGMVAVRLCDVAPDGTSNRITYGLLNLQHRGGFASAQPLVPGERYQVTVKLNDVAYAIEAGHRLRVAVSTAYWPLAMPASARPLCVTIHGGGLAVPLRQSRAHDVAPVELGPPVSPSPLKAEVLVPPERGRLRMGRDLVSGLSRVEVVRNLGALRIEDVDLELKALGSETYTIRPDDPSTVRSETHRLAEFRRADWHAAVETRSTLTMQGGDWRLEARLEARDGETIFFERSWDLSIPRSTATGGNGKEPKGRVT
ncbi:MAG: CocE/NonD family hydrolase [Hyphomicrobiales bacterium]